METTEISEMAEHAEESGGKVVGLTMAIVAVLLALATMLGHRMHTEEILIQTKANDQWAYYQAKNIRSHMYEANAEMAALVGGGTDVAAKFRKESEDQKKSAEEIQSKARELEEESAGASRKADRFDMAEIFLEIAIVLCSITLLTRARIYWLSSFVSTGLGVVFMAWALLI